MVRMSGTAPGWTPVGSRGGGRWELLVFLLHLARFARALRGDWHRLGKQTDGFYRCRSSAENQKGVNAVKQCVVRV